jgi:hypothetical protein
MKAGPVLAIHLRGKVVTYARREEKTIDILDNDGSQTEDFHCAQPQSMTSQSMTS